MFGGREEIRLELNKWARRAARRLLKRSSSYATRTLQMRAALDQAYKAMAQLVESGPSSDRVDAAMEAIDLVLRR